MANNYAGTLPTPKGVYEAENKPALSFTVPSRWYPEYLIVEHVNRVAAAFAAHVAKKLNTPITEIEVVDALPQTHLTITGVANNEDWVLPVIVANVWTNYCNQLLPANRFMCIFGVTTLQATPTMVGVRFLNGAGTTLGSYQIQKGFGTLEPIQFFSQPPVWNANDTVLVQVLTYAAVVAATQRYPLLALVGQPKQLIS